MYVAIDAVKRSFSAFQMKEVCLLNLDDGKAKDWEQSLKETITDKFIESTPELQEIIDSKRGFWSTIKGWWQWIVWIVTGTN